MKDKKKEKTFYDGILLGIIITLIILVVFVVAYLFTDGEGFYEEEKPSTDLPLDNKKVYFSDDKNIGYDIGYTPAYGMRVNYSFVDYSYSKRGYIQVTPNEDERVIVVECINATLMISDNKIYCNNEKLNPSTDRVK